MRGREANLDVGKVVPTQGGARVHEHCVQLVLDRLGAGGTVGRGRGRVFPALLPLEGASQALPLPREKLCQIPPLGKGKCVVHLDAAQRVPVKVEAAQLEGEQIRQPRDAQALESLHASALVLVFIVSRQQLTRHVADAAGRGVGGAGGRRGITGHARAKAGLHASHAPHNEGEVAELLLPLAQVVHLGGLRARSPRPRGGMSGAEAGMQAARPRTRR